MPTYKLGELIEKMEPQTQRDKALMGRCVDGLGLYAAQIAAVNKTANKIDEIRKFAERLVGYWGLDCGENVTPPRDLLEAFDERVSNAKTGGAVMGDVYQSAPNVIFGLHRYGEDMVVSQGEDAMGDILDVRDLMKEIAAAWEFEPDVLNDLTAHLEREVREMLDNITLPGQPTSGLKNTDYEITQAVLFDNDRGFALAHSPTAPANYVTWQFTNEDGKFNHYWGRYIESEERALIDYISRVADYKETYKVTEKPFPITAAEVGTASPSVPAPESENGEKPSVMEKIRAAQNAPKEPPKPKPERDKKKQEPEL